MTAQRPPAEPSFIKREMMPNRGPLLKDVTLWLAVGAGIVAAPVFRWLESSSHVDRDAVDSFLTALLTMASITLGFLTTALVMGLSLAKDSIDFLLAQSKRYGAERSPFAQLSFAIVWSALAQVFLIILVLTDMLLLAIDGPLGHGISLGLGAFLLVGTTVYAVGQFVSALLTLSQVSDTLDRGPAPDPTSD